jgi:lipopolysaccharide transport system permease protein
LAVAGNSTLGSTLQDPDQAARPPQPIERELPLLVIEPPRGWQWLNVRELWAYRELMYFFAWRDVKVRYKQTVLGAGWAVIQPLTMMTIFTLVLGGTAGARTLSVPYSIFVFCGLMAWMLFATALAGAASSLIESERLITKIAFPRLLIPAAAVGPASIDFSVTCLALAGLLVSHGLGLAATTPLAILAIGVIVATVIGAGTFLAALNVMYRDFRYTTTFLLQAWMFATPAIYIAPTEGDAGAAFHAASPAAWFELANPLNGAVAFFRAALLGWPLPWMMLGASALVAGLMLVVGLAYFRRTEDSFADII